MLQHVKTAFINKYAHSNTISSETHLPTSCTAPCVRKVVYRRKGHLVILPDRDVMALRHLDAVFFGPIQIHAKSRFLNGRIRDSVISTY